MVSAAEVQTLRHAIGDAFPPQIFTGSVTSADGADWDEAIEEDLELWHSLKGKVWTAIPPDFVDRHAYDLPLFTPEALAAFLPAWLLRALEPFPEESVVRDQIVFTLASSTNFDPHGQDAFHQRGREQRQQFTPEQREVLRQFLRIVGQADLSPIIQKEINSASKRLF